MALPSGSSPTSSPRVALVRQGRQVVAAVAQAGGSDVVLGLFGAFQRIFGGTWLGARRVGALNNPDNQTRHPGGRIGRFGGQKAPRQCPLESGRVLPGRGARGGSRAGHMFPRRVCPVLT